MQLRNDNPLGTVDDEGTGIGHQWDFSHVYFLALYLLHDLGRRRRLLVVKNQLHQHTQGCCIVRTTLLAFLYIECGFTQPIVDIFENGMTGMTRDRKDGAQGRMQAFVRPFGQGNLGL